MNDVLEPPDEHRSSTPTATPGVPAGLRPETPAAEDVTDFSAFYRTEIKPLVNFLLWMGASLADATSIAQEAMIEVYKNWSSVKKHRAWARRVASRKYGRLRFSQEVPTEPEILSPLLRTVDETTSWGQRHDVLQLVATLPDRQRQVMAWTLDDYTPQEIAEELGIKPDAVRASLRLARRALAEKLGKEGESA